MRASLRNYTARAAWMYRAARLLVLTAIVFLSLLGCRREYAHFLVGNLEENRDLHTLFELLEQEQGIAPEKFDSVYAPIGIDIGAQTPGEIAICILAEIINVMRDGPAISLSEQIRVERQTRRDRARDHS